jgi:hypothetical protein
MKRNAAGERLLFGWELSFLAFAILMLTLVVVAGVGVWVIVRELV